MQKICNVVRKNGRTYFTNLASAYNSNFFISMLSVFNTYILTLSLTFSLVYQSCYVDITIANSSYSIFVSRSIKAALLPAIANVSYTFCTRALSNLNKPNFGENFPVAISKPKLVTKTLQVCNLSFY